MFMHRMIEIVTLYARNISKMNVNSRVQPITKITVKKEMLSNIMEVIKFL